MIPSLMRHMGGDVKRVRLSILLGSTLALVIYLIWQVIVLGIVPLEGPSGILESLKRGREASESISGILGSTWVSHFATLLAFFAILTSFLSQALSLTHFWADGLKVSYEKQESIPLCLCSLLPPLIFSLLYPQIFFKALNFAGGICAVILFGILPVLMVWRGRKIHQFSSSYQLKGGKFLLIGIFLFGIFISFSQLSQMVYIPYLTKTVTCLG
jgi:tyrosine-specific transport protein